ncbi:hypothetical protein I3842_15G019100 [Carya illinoinensis]|uniref:Reticulon domain-containing protein n=1 Tax=Carya illinoinensis TaxID=32201 RepID=A0A922D5X5_CARIL|nr:hypothetical protein I3842_15G019100 [Carya illinoinensis]
MDRFDSILPCAFAILKILFRCFFVFSILLLWSNASTFIQKRPPHIPQFHIPEEPLLEFAAALRIEINRAFIVLRDIASGTINRTPSVNLIS